MNTKSSSKLARFMRNHKIGIVIVSIVTIFLALAYGLPFCVGSGTDKFSGTEKKIAEQALKDQYAALDNMHKIDVPPVIYYVEEVQLMSPEQVKEYCNLQPGGDMSGYYNVIMSNVTYFGIRTSKSTNQGDCIK